MVRLVDQLIAIQLQFKIHVLSIILIFYPELSCAFSKIEDLDVVVYCMGLKYLQIARPALFLASKAFLTYRQKGGGKHKTDGQFFCRCARRSQLHAIAY
jgi:hypothetical protein